MTLTNQELSALKFYHQKVVELNEAMDHMPQKLSIKISEDGASFYGDLDNLHTAGFVALTRIFTLKKDDVSFYKIRNILSRYYIGDARKIGRLKGYKRAWGKAFGPNLYIGTGAKIDGRDITNGDIYDLIVNGQHSHSDRAKRELLEQLRNGLTLLFVEMSFRMILIHIHTLVMMMDQEFVEPILKG